MSELTDSPLWQPSADRAAASHLRRFIEMHRSELTADDYTALYAWSIEQPAAFWAAIWDFCGIGYAHRYETVLEDGEHMPGARWFRGATLNFAQNLLFAERDGPALIFHSETGERSELGWAELKRQVANVSATLRSLGVAAGDRVAGFLPNRPETVVAMLAAASIGAVWSSCSPDFGVPAVLARFGQIEPKVLFAVDGYFYGGKRFDTRPAVAALTEGLPSVETVIMVGYLEPNGAAGGPEGALDFRSAASGSARLEFASLPFSHPLYILYSSGTTGVPKCIVHAAGSTLLQHKKEHMLHTDIHPGDVVFYYTTCGWMMWNWLVSALASEATLLLYDGAPFEPSPATLWRIAADERVKVFGTSARYLGALEKSGYRPREHATLEDLASILSTGSPLAPESFDFVYRDLKHDVQLSSISGGTEIVSCFALGNPLLPVYRGELQCRGLGMRVEIFDHDGQSVCGEKGELVCTAPFPSMPIGFWNDPDDTHYRAAYFQRFPGVWCHGDYAELTSHGGLIIYGRSDAVLNPGGVRIGTAEIYRIVEQFPEVLESVAVGQDWQGDQRIVLFLRLREGSRLDAALDARLRQAVREQASPRHVPAKIVAVADIPHTINGKLVELAVRDVIHGREVANRSVLANPEALELFRNLKELAD